MLAPVFTARLTALPSETTKTALSFTAASGRYIGLDWFAACRLVASLDERYARVHLGTQIVVRVLDFHFDLHGRLLAIRFGRDLVITPSYLRSG